MSEPPRRGRVVHGAATQLLSLALIVLGVAILVKTLTAGVDGVAVGLLLGPLFCAAGIGRLWIARRTG